MNTPVAWPASQIVMRATDALIPYARNSRTHSPEQVAQIAASIREFGWTVPVLIDETGMIIAGHGRVMAAQILDIAEIPAMVATGWTKAQKQAYVIADNKLAENAGWDSELLKIEVADLAEMGFDLDLLGFNDADLAGLLGMDQPEETEADPDEAPDLEEAAVSQLGDMWILGPHRVICGSSTDMAVWGDLMRGEKADICWTDPPYNVDYVTTGVKKTKIKNDALRDQDFRALLDSAFACIRETLKPGAPIYVAHADIEGLNFRGAFAGAGFKLSGCLIWRKHRLSFGQADYHWMHEPILYGWKPGAKHRWYGGRKQVSVIDRVDGENIIDLGDGRCQIQVGQETLIVDGAAQLATPPATVLHDKKPNRSDAHPTMKPVGLIEQMLQVSSRSGDIVIDAFAGSGSTLIAADRMGQSARVVELDPRYVDVIVKRWQEFTGREATLDATGATFADVGASRSAA